MPSFRKAVANALRYRAFPVAELRAEPELRLEGLAAPYGVWTRIGPYEERIAPGAFTAAIRGARDVLALKDHNPQEVLGRQSNGSLEFDDRADGLHVRMTLPRTRTGIDVHTLAEGGYLGGMSIGFAGATQERDGPRTTLTSIDLVEVSVVSHWPAYPTTTVEARTAETLATWRAWLRSVS